MAARPAVHGSRVLEVERCRARTRGAHQDPAGGAFTHKSVRFAHAGVHKRDAPTRRTVHPAPVRKRDAGYPLLPTRNGWIVASRTSSASEERPDAKRRWLSR